MNCNVDYTKQIFQIGKKHTFDLQSKITITRNPWDRLLRLQSSLQLKNCLHIFQCLQGYTGKVCHFHCTVGHDLDKTPLKPKSTNAFGYWWTLFGRWCMTWNLSLAPFRAEASYVTQIHFFLQYASSYVSPESVSDVKSTI